jgi:hypothetical protein
MLVPLLVSDELSAVQAALLVAGQDPSVDAEYIEGWSPEKRPFGHEAAKTAISNALRRGTIVGHLIPKYEYDINGNLCGEIDGSIDVGNSRIDVNSLETWLASRGLSKGFFSGTRRAEGLPRSRASSLRAETRWRGTGLVSAGKRISVEGEVAKTSPHEMASRAYAGIRDDRQGRQAERHRN